MQPHQNYWRNTRKGFYTNYETMTYFSKPRNASSTRRRWKYLGLVVEEGKISTDLIKVKGFADWPIPTSVKDVRSFLGFGNFYQKFIPGFLTLAAPLNALLKKDTIFKWTEELSNHSIL